MVHAFGILCTAYFVQVALIHFAISNCHTTVNLLFWKFACRYVILAWAAECKHWIRYINMSGVLKLFFLSDCDTILCLLPLFRFPLSVHHFPTFRATLCTILSSFGSLCVASLEFLARLMVGWLFHLCIYFGQKKLLLWLSLSPSPSSSLPISPLSPDLCLLFLSPFSPCSFHYFCPLPDSALLDAVCKWWRWIRREFPLAL